MSETFDTKFDRAFVTGIFERKQREERIKQARLLAEQERERKREERKNEVWDKYFPKNEEEESLQAGLLKVARNGMRMFFFKFDRKDFEGWHNLVEGGYKNAHPVDMLDKMLTHAREKHSLPGCISWDIRNNCGVVFNW